MEARKMKAANPAQYYRQNLGQLGFGDPEHALVQTLKELIDNSLDSCEVMGILPDIKVEISAMRKRYEVVTDKAKDGVRAFPIFRIAVEDNGCGIVKEKVAKCFGTVLYGSKFFSFKQSRGQQGIGAHAAIIYAQLTSLEPAVIITKTAKDVKGRKIVLKIDTDTNTPIIFSNEEVTLGYKKHGTRIELMVAGDFTEKVESFISELLLANPHADLKFTIKTDPDQEARFVHYKRAVSTIPPAPKEIKPHLLSMEPGALLEMVTKDACCKKAKRFLTEHFVRISDEKALALLKTAGVAPTALPKEINVEALLKAARECDLMRPPLDVLSPIGEAELKASLRRVFPDAEFIATVSRYPWSYRGVPFQVEVGVAYGGAAVIKACDTVREAVFKSKVIRLGNKCPLIYDSKDCLLYKVVKEVNWRNYRLPQERGNLPAAPAVFVVSLTATKVPYTAPGKFAIAYHDEIREQLKLALQELGRAIHSFIRRRKRQEYEMHRQNIFQVYGKEVARDLSMLSNVGEGLLFERLINAAKGRKKDAASGGGGEEKREAAEEKEEEEEKEKGKVTAEPAEQAGGIAKIEDAGVAPMPARPLADLAPPAAAGGYDLAPAQVGAGIEAPESGGSLLTEPLSAGSAAEGGGDGRTASGRGAAGTVTGPPAPPAAPGAALGAVSGGVSQAKGRSGPRRKRGDGSANAASAKEALAERSKNIQGTLDGYL